MNGSHWLVSNNVITTCGWCMFDNFGNGDTDVTWDGNDLSGFGHAIMFATATPNFTASFLRVSNNTFHDLGNWSAPGCPAHNDGVHLFGATNGTSRIDQVFFHDNYLYGDLGPVEGAGQDCFQALLYVENGSTNPAGAQNLAAWNNVMDETNGPGTVYSSQGVLAIFVGLSGSQIVVNNTTVCYPGTGGGGVPYGYGLQSLSGLRFMNNVSNTCANPIATNLANITITAFDYNQYGGSTYCSGGNCFTSGQSFLGSLANWRAACNCDSHSGQTVAGTGLALNADWSPSASSPAYHTGTNICALISCTGELAGLVNDTSLAYRRTPVARGTLWSVGAFQGP